MTLLELPHKASLSWEKKKKKRKQLQPYKHFKPETASNSLDQRTIVV